MDCLLGSLDRIVKDKGILVWLYLLTIVFLDAFVKLQGYDFTFLNSEGFTKLFFSNIVRDELDINIGIEGLLEALSNRVKFRAMQFFFLFANVLVNDQELIFSDLFLVHLL